MAWMRRQSHYADTQGETVIYSDKLRIAKIDAGSAVLGSLSIAGVRLTIRQGRVEGTSKDIDAGTVALAKSSTLPDGGSLGLRQDRTAGVRP